MAADRLEGSPLREAEVGRRPVIVHLSGGGRGRTQYLNGDRFRLGTDRDVEIRLPHEQGSPVAPVHALLEKRGEVYEILAEPGQEVWVNGRRSDSHVLESGDLLELGRDGPVLRFRLHPQVRRDYKLMTESFRDCLDCAREDGETFWQRARIFLSQLVRDVSTQTSRWFRLAVGVMLLVLVGSSVTLAVRSFRLERQLESERSRWSALGGVVEGWQQQAVLTRDDLVRVRDDLSADLVEAEERLVALEERAGAGQRVIAEAARSVVFLQGAYGFQTPDGHSLRFAVGEDGSPLLDADGSPGLTLGGEGPLLERLYTGTAFVATDDRLLLTNRHVAIPWDYDDAAKLLEQRGLRPVMHRFVGYLPGLAEPFEVEQVADSDTADVAVLRCGPSTDPIPGLPISEILPSAGDEVVVMGYPTGIRALLARTDETFLATLMGEGDLDFWEVARRLAAAGRIAPLATRGIVGQITDAAIVYDAPTTHGGSGGPVLGLDGRVVAVNAAILPGFEGSNLGVPAAEARRLLELARAETVEDGLEGGTASSGEPQ